MNSHDAETIKHLLKFLKSKDGLHKKNRKLLGESIKAFRQCAQLIGLTNEQIFSVADIAATQKFDEVNTNWLIHSLIPRESISEDTILMVISKICSDAQSLKIKCLLIRWIVLVFDLIAVKTRLHSVYSLLFHYTQNDTLSPYICHLLYLLTRKSDVTHYRITRLLEFQRKVGSQPHLSGLLSLYRMFHPSLISMAGSYKSFFKTDKKWEKSIFAVQKKYGFSLFNEALGYTCYGAKKDHLKSDKLIHQPSLSMVHSSDVEQPLSGFILGKTPIHQIKSFQELLNNVGQLAANSQAFTLLSSRTLQHVMALTPDRTVALRLSFWLHNSLSSELLHCNGETEKGRELLCSALKFCLLIQECIPVCEEFLFRYLWTWNGRDYRKYIFKMISKLRIMPFQELRVKVLVPLQKLFSLSSHVYYKCSIISCLSDLLSNYLNVECERHQAMLENNDDSDYIRYSGFCQRPTSNIDVDSTLSELVQFVDRLFMMSVQTVDNRELLLYYVLLFHLQVSHIFMLHKKSLVILPSAPLLFYSLFSLSSPCFLLMLRILCNHFNSANALKKASSNLSNVVKSLDLLNRYCLDVFDAIWRRRSFNPQCQENTVVFQDVHVSSFEELLSHSQDLPACRMFSVDRHPSLIAYTKEYIKIHGKSFSDVEEAEFVVDLDFAHFLESKGLEDINNFISLLLTN